MSALTQVEQAKKISCKLRELALFMSKASLAIQTSEAVTDTVWIEPAETLCDALERYADEADEMATALQREG